MKCTTSLRKQRGKNRCLPLISAPVDIGILPAKSQRQRHDNKENNDPNSTYENSGTVSIDSPSSKKKQQEHLEDSGTDCEISGTVIRKARPPQRRRQMIDNADVQIIMNGEMLNDAIINKAQTLLHDPVPGVGGLEDTTLGPISMFSIQRGEFVQVLHDGSIHWVCVSNIGCKDQDVSYYDSLSGSRVSWSLVQQITSIIHADKSELVVRTRKVQKQTNSVDCGIFALAFATSLLNGINPEEETYSVADLRPHLVDCLQFGKMTKFPIMTRTVFPRVRSMTVENIVDAPTRVFGYAIVCKPKLVCFVCTVDLMITHVIFGISRFARDHWNAVK